MIDYYNDPGCSSETDPDEYNPPLPPPPPPAPPPPPDLDPGLEPGAFSTWEAESSPHPWYTNARCKRQEFIHPFRQLDLYDVIRYEGQFRVCYVPNGKIVSWSAVVGDAAWVRPYSGWEWRGNEAGYPYGVRTWFGQIEFRYRGKAAFCILSIGCGPEKHPWVTLTFYSNNTISRSSGVV